VNNDPWSDMMLLGRPWVHTMWAINPLAKSFRPMVSLHATKWAIFVTQSTMTRKALLPSASGNPVMKSMDIESHGLVGNCSGLRSPKGAWQIGFILLHVSQLSTYLCMY
jgi:hypothetical protein